MTDRPDILRIAIAQINPTVGDVLGNLELARTARADAARHGADIVVFSELFMSGYSPEDLVLKPAFVEDCMEAVKTLAKDTADGGPGIIMGVPWREQEGPHKGLYNAVAIIDGGEVIATRFKVDLPNYGVFDEKRVFDTGPMSGPVNFRGVLLGIPICEDIWGDLEFAKPLLKQGRKF